MISAVIFDLDGVLIQSEKMKALSYAIAVQQLRKLPEPEQRAIEAYREVVGAPREIAARYIVDKLNLTNELRPLTAQYKVSVPWEVLVAMRTSIYNEMVADPQVLRDNKWPHTVELLKAAKETLCMTALVTMSKCNEVLHVLHSLDIELMFDVVITTEDVTHGKPDPEIYLLAAKKLSVPPGECLAIEDSVNGVRAAKGAGTNVIAIATPFTNAGLHESRIVDDAWIVHNPDELPDVVRRRIEEHEATAHAA